MKIFKGTKVPIESWCNNPEKGAIEQALKLTELPFIFKQVCLMPDTHQGYGMPIGGVIACKDAIIPNAVGVDIGCGLCAVKTDILIEDMTLEKLKKILGGSKEYQGGIKSHIPTGFNHHSANQEWSGFDRAPNIAIVQKEVQAAQKQLGTLGGGNHFIEIQKGSDGYIWIMAHSGSRNFGFQIAKYFNKVAQHLCKKWHSDVPLTGKGTPELAFLPIDTDEGHAYIIAMRYACDFAHENRIRMIEQCKKEFFNIMPCKFDEIINIHHNYATIENHFKSNVWVHRKGATSATNGEIGIIPGSQGTASYIVKGKGNPESFMSCSHGAGRKMSRKEAKETLDLEYEKKILNKKGILHGVNKEKDLDEATGAYKDIDIVMKEQEDLVEILIKLEPLAVIKG